MIALIILLSIASSIEVNLMLPLDVVTSQGIRNPEQLQNDLNKIKSSGVVGVMSDIYWGLVETSPKTYNWDSYEKLVSMVKTTGLKLKVALYFHKCGNGVGDIPTIHLPLWAEKSILTNDAFFKDAENRVIDEYISFAFDDEKVFEGRTPIEIYGDFMASFKQNFQKYIDDGTIKEIQIGMGIKGETRYPSFPLNLWSYCGVGAFQCSDKKSQQKLKNAANATGHPEWGHNPTNAGYYNNMPPTSTGFFGNDAENYQSEYGKFFQQWYFDLLLSHTDKILFSARTIFGDSLFLVGKISCIHWWWMDDSHAGEMTAGYYNSNGNNAYNTLSNIFEKYNITFDFTTLEMLGTDVKCGSQPVSLIDQAYSAASSVGLTKCGENEYDMCGYGGCNTNGFIQINKKAKEHNLSSFSYNRMTRALLDDATAWKQFCDFVNLMK
ncbi:beta-amylase, putative [Entamoeba invadens IP1]|uniref:Beta-amylase n=1 Tax=Entamoeba invadens IP1 TaxID=370355 RepID=A0A0A1U7E8_ENTIV|nr:beta-amylase, putative [Entamoeba invadens IP1]ELP90316.1 beta-amylase, putative [Entamoeba invadens IP1]|eukprot:XP_004257087.1 beta-amylase, putative [Entamoeba invadens IP1]